MVVCLLVCLKNLGCNSTHLPSGLDCIMIDKRGYRVSNAKERPYEVLSHSG